MTSNSHFLQSLLKVYHVALDIMSFYYQLLQPGYTGSMSSAAANVLLFIAASMLTF